jgi:hypothetical protein
MPSVTLKDQVKEANDLRKAAEKAAKDAEDAMTIILEEVNNALPQLIEEAINTAIVGNPDLMDLLEARWPEQNSATLSNGVGSVVPAMRSQLLAYLTKSYA